MKPIELIKETVEFYSKDPINRRAFKVDTSFNGVKMQKCNYRIGDKKCAVGRLMKKEALENRWVILNYSAAMLNIFTDVNCLLKDEYKDTPVELLSDLQKLHDKEYFWTSTGLSKAGKEQVENLIDKWK